MCATWNAEVYGVLVPRTRDPRTSCNSWRWVTQAGPGAMRARAAGRELESASGVPAPPHGRRAGRRGRSRTSADLLGSGSPEPVRRPARMIARSRASSSSVPKRLGHVVVGAGHPARRTFSRLVADRRRASGSAGRPPLLADLAAHVPSRRARREARGRAPARRGGRVASSASACFLGRRRLDDVASGPPGRSFRPRTICGSSSTTEHAGRRRGGSSQRLPPRLAAEPGDSETGLADDREADRKKTCRGPGAGLQHDPARRWPRRRPREIARPRPEPAPRAHRGPLKKRLETTRGAASLPW